MTQVLRRLTRVNVNIDTTEPSRSSGGEKRETAPAARMVTLLTVAVLVVAVAAIDLSLEHTHALAVQHARTDALNAAQADVKDILSYDYRTMDHDLATSKSEMTAQMAKSYDEYWRTTLAPAVATAQAIVQTTLQVAGVSQATADRVEVVLFVKMLSVNVIHKDPQVDEARLKLIMKKVRGRWLIDGPLPTAKAPQARSQPSSPPSPSSGSPSPTVTHP